MSNLLTVSQAAELLGVSTKTIRRWETEGRIKSIRTEGGHRRFTVSNLIGNKQDNSLTVAYARVSSHDQKDDLKRQKIVLEAYCAQQGWSFEVISDSGSGLNYRKKGLIKLIKLICSEQVERLVLTHKDRLLRFGSDLIFTLCEIFGTEVVIINRSEDSTFEEVLAQDVLEIITVFSARLYGSRSLKNKEIVKQLKEVANQLK
ncbi:MAG: IS607 family transposase [Okeania sp. SIO2F4]|uniref:IS607 family transposase n=1 Tax=Okeania sp. SIO2F4 TaxID=2607790 RepID=UPI00142ACF15|nr:IS607 family transposase [Okeania sp. SIO2F4]MDJ0517438.1 IS607 family transposase [Trichodesmium sp. MO_231.B1]NES07309.1 IS607 family transposase [Okeania sp. SIO2F4]